MKKSLIALAVVGAFSAPAFADTTLYGVADVALAGASANNQALRNSGLVVVSSGLATSRLGVKGAEDVGDGLKVVYQYEVGLDFADSNGLNGAAAAGSGAVNTNGAARQKLVGVSGDFGTVVAGYLQTTGYDFGNKYDPTAGSVVSPLQNVTSGKALIGIKGVAARAPRAIALVTPSIYGLTIAVNYASSLSTTSALNLGNLGITESAASGNTTATLMSVSYDQGPLSVGGVYAKVANAALAVGADNQHEYSLGASYDLGVAKLFGTYQANQNWGTVVGDANKEYSLSGVIPAGPGAVAVSYAHGSETATGAADQTGSSYTGAYLWSLSKTATVYAAYSHATNASNNAGYSVDNSLVGAAVGNGGSSTLLALGLKKNF